MAAALICSKPSLDVVKGLLSLAHLPTSDLNDGHCENFFFAGDIEKPRGIVGIEMPGDLGLLRSLVVDERSRGSGLGSSLVAHVENYARSNGVRALYLLTTTAEPFFAARGYHKANRDEAPSAIKSTREFSDICPANSSFMIKNL